MKKSLVIGIDFYPNLVNLNGCVKDACSVESILKRNGDGTLNFDVELLTCTSEKNLISKTILIEKIKDLFKNNNDISLLYFAGHGYTNEGHGYIITSECKQGEDGIRMEDIMEIVNKSKILNKILIFDCCHAGEIATNIYFNSISTIGDGVTILSACTKGQYAEENSRGGVFTNLLVDALNGGAANIIGQISPGSVYSHIDQSLSAWEQRPVFKTNVERFISLRNVTPAISLNDLRKITEFFNNPNDEFKLNPSFEFTHESAIEENVKSFKILQKMHGLNLIRPVNEEFMFYAAINNDCCKLTTLGEHYWYLVKKGRI